VFCIPDGRWLRDIFQEERNRIIEANNLPHKLNKVQLKAALDTLGLPYKKTALKSVLVKQLEQARNLPPSSAWIEEPLEENENDTIQDEEEEQEEEENEHILFEGNLPVPLTPLSFFPRDDISRKVLEKHPLFTGQLRSELEAFAKGKERSSLPCLSRFLATEVSPISTNTLCNEGSFSVLENVLWKKGKLTAAHASGEQQHKLNVTAPLKRKHYKAVRPIRKKKQINKWKVTHVGLEGIVKDHSMDHSAARWQEAATAVRKRKATKKIAEPSKYRDALEELLAKKRRKKKNQFSSDAALNMELPLPLKGKQKMLVRPASYTTIVRSHRGTLPWPAVAWCEKNAKLFPLEFRKTVFCILCVNLRAGSEALKNHSKKPDKKKKIIWPYMPLDVLCNIFQQLAYLYT
jgi:hypothetical protein